MLIFQLILFFLISLISLITFAGYGQILISNYKKNFLESTFFGFLWLFSAKGIEKNDALKFLHLNFSIGYFIGRPVVTSVLSWYASYSRNLKGVSGATVLTDLKCRRMFLFYCQNIL